jgi:hypothetical protein
MFDIFNVVLYKNLYIKNKAFENILTFKIPCKGLIGL